MTHRASQALLVRFVRRLSRLLLLLLTSSLPIGASAGCSEAPTLLGPELGSVSKLTPTTIENDAGEARSAGWALFDRDVETGYTPAAGEELVLRLGRSAPVLGIKVHSADAVRLRVLDASGEVIDGLASIAVEGGGGWQVFLVDAVVRTDALRVVFDEIGSQASIAELEVWTGVPAGGLGDVDLRQDGAIASAPHLDVVPIAGQVSIRPSGTSVDACERLTFELARHPGAYRRAFLVFRGTNVFRPFVLWRSLNGKAGFGGEWAPDGDGSNAFVQPIDPGQLARGENDLEVCLPREASEGVALEGLTLVGELDDGASSIASMHLEGSDEPANLPITLDAGQSLDLRLERTSAPDLVRLALARSSAGAWDFACVALDGSARALETEALSGAEGETSLHPIRVRGERSACERLRISPRDGRATIADVELLAPGARRRIDFPQVVLASPQEHFGTEAWIEGWVRRPADLGGAVRISVDGAELDTTTGTFGVMLERDPAVAAEPWVVTIAARLPNGHEVDETFVLETDSSGELARARAAHARRHASALARYGARGARASRVISSGEAAEVWVGSDVGVSIPEGAVDGQANKRVNGGSTTTTVAVRHLDPTELPPMDPALINVTAERGDAYEFLPHGTTFRRPVTITLPYDPTLIPEGMSEADVVTYYYDTYAERWVALDRAGVDTAGDKVLSTTDHFTVMINAVLTVPENAAPQSFDPTTISSLPVANPAANVDLIQPPQATSSGDANLSHPVRLPPGRGAYSPELAFSYSSGGGNGWLGLGWDLRLSRIEIDTRFGVPTYEADEEPRYLLDGTALVPTGEEEGPTCRNGRRYRPRVEGGFSHILRCGSGPADYYWEIRDTRGTRYTYGDRAEAGPSEPPASVPYSDLADPRTHGIFAWHLRRVEDTNRNVTTFRYQRRDAAPDYGGEPYVQVYPAGIDYTAHEQPHQDARYHVDFILDQGSRRDVSVSGRPGFKTLARHLLRSVQVRFDDEIVREYVLDYRVGQFEKTLLERIRVFGLGGCGDLGTDAISRTEGTTTIPEDSACAEERLFQAHTLDYHGEEERFAPVEAWEAPLPRALTEARAIGGNGHVYLGVSLGKEKGRSIGVRVGFGGTRRTQRVSTLDVNGDGLPDQIFETDDEEPGVLYNQFVPADPSSRALRSIAPPGDPSESGMLAIEGLRGHVLGQDRTRTVNFGIQAHFSPAQASLGWTWSRSSGHAFLADLNGDGFVDLLENHRGFYANRRAGGIIEFLPGSFGALAGIDPSADAMLAAMQSDIERDIFLIDPVKKWVAPYGGRVRVHALAQFAEPRPESGDGVEIDLLFAPLPNIDPATGVANPPAPLVPIGACVPEGGGAPASPCVIPTTSTEPRLLTGDGGAELVVAAGDALFLRVSSVSDVPYEGSTPLEVLETELMVDYEELCLAGADGAEACSVLDAGDLAMVDPTGAPVFHFDGTGDFRTAGGPPTFAALPSDGHVEVHAVLRKPTRAADSVRVCLQRFDGSALVPEPPDPEEAAEEGNEDGDDEEDEEEEPELVEPDYEAEGCDSTADFVNVLYDEEIAWDATGAFAIDADLDVAQDDLLVLRIESDFAVDPAGFTVEETSIVYTNVCSTPVGGSTTCFAPTGGCEAPFDQSGRYCFDASGFEPYFVLPSVATAGDPRRWVAPNDGTLAIAGDVVVPANGVVALRSSNPEHHVIFKQRVSGCAPGSCVVTLDETVSVLAGEHLTLETSVEPADGQVVSAADVTASVGLSFDDGSGGSPIGSYASNLVHVATPISDLFAGGYRGFRYGAWNHSVVPFDPRSVDPVSGDDLSGKEARRRKRELKRYRDSDSPEERREIRLNESRASLTWIPVHPTRYAQAAGAPAWITADGAAFLAGASMHSARFGGGAHRLNAALEARGESEEDLELGSATTPDNYARLSVTNSRHGGIGLGPLDLSVSTNVTTTTTDVVDMNGDGIADVLAHGYVLRGTLTDGASELEGHDLGEPVRERVGRSFNVGLGINAPEVQTTSTGLPAEVSTKMPSEQEAVADASAGFGLAFNRSATRTDLTDVNGDGLPDRVTRNADGSIRVELNLGHRFATVADTYAAARIEGGVDNLSPDSEDTDLPEDLEAEELHPDSLTANDPNALQHETTITTSANLSGTAPIAQVGAHVQVNSSSTRVVTDLVDINGDGLPDLLFKRSDEDQIRVQYNLGDGFAAPEVWETGRWELDGEDLLLAGGPIGELPVPGGTVAEYLSKLTGPDTLSGTGRLTLDGENLGAEVGVFFSVFIPLPVPWVKIILNPGATLSFSTDAFELALMDIDGDGSADHVLRRAGMDELFVKRNQVTGRANLLAEVVNPLGGTISLDYARTPNTVDMPQSRQVLSRVVVDDGVDLGAAFASPNQVVAMSYSDGYYDRHEREFFGFGTVTTNALDETATVVRSVVRTFHNNEYALRGTLASETQYGLRDGALVPFVQRRNDYEVRAVESSNGDAVVGLDSCIASKHPLLPDSACTPVFPALVEARTEVTEGAEPGLGLGKVHVERNVAFDRFGNVVESVDEADDSTSADDVYAFVTPRNDLARWIVGLPEHLVVRAPSESGLTLVRERRGVYDASGDLREVHVTMAAGAAPAVTKLDYDEYGNLERVETPPNSNGETLVRTIGYDAATHQYPASVGDSFGYSASTTYDPRFGAPLVVTDVNGNTLTRSYDGFGRLLSVRGPYDGADPGLSITYLADAVADRPTTRAITVQRPGVPAGYTGVVPAAQTTVSAADGFGRVVQTRKTSVVDGVYGMTTSGAARMDALGRTTATYHPFFTAGLSTAFVEPSSTYATEVVFDALDRPVQTTYPDDTTLVQAYALAAVPGPTGARMLQQTVTDANGHHREVYTDLAERTVAFVEHPSATSAAVTRYGYSALGELTSIVDADGNVTTIGYDLRGLRTALNNPDTGLIETVYDAMGNAVAKIEPNHRAAGTRVQYRFRFDRLEGIDYPTKPDVTLAYGAANAPVNHIGRLLSVTDETGTRTRTYGALGEVLSERRTVDIDAPGQQPLNFETRFVYDSLGRLLELTYPDGEVLRHAYDQGGNLASVTGAGAGWTQTYVSELRYDVFGNRIHARSGNGVASDWSYDPAMARLATARTVLPGGDEIQDLAYAYDPVGNPQTIASSLPNPGASSQLPGPGTLSLVYDGVDRLRTATGSLMRSPGKTESYVQTFEYDLIHNITRKARTHTIANPSGSETTPPHTNIDFAYEYDGPRPHGATVIGDLELAYDPSGNVITRTTVGTGRTEHLTWDDDGRMVEHQGPGGRQRNWYDAEGRRVMRKGHYGEIAFANEYFQLRGSTQATKHVFAGGMRIASVLAHFTGATTNGGGNGNGNGNGGGGGGTPTVPPAPADPGHPFYFHPDHLGSTSVLTDEDGEMHQHLAYFPDGEEWFTEGPQRPINGYRFSGEFFDPETGFYEFEQRYYDPRDSIWLSIDPIIEGLSAESDLEPRALNVYAYAANSSFSYIDPDGRDAVIVHGGGPAGNRNGVRELGRTVRTLVNPSAPNQIREHRPSITWDGALSDGTGPGVRMAQRHRHRADSPRVLAGFSLGADAVLQTGRSQGGRRWDLRVAVGARVGDDFVQRVEQAAANSEQVILVGIEGDTNLENDDSAFAEMFGGGFGDRSFEGMTGAIEQQYGTMERFYEAHPNVVVMQAPRGSHSGGGNRRDVMDAVRRGHDILRQRESASGETAR